jgi:hypothetical protein
MNGGPKRGGCPISPPFSLMCRSLFVGIRRQTIEIFSDTSRRNCSAEIVAHLDIS